jgi:mannosyl-3-phosphoglycerate phosphatase
MKKLIIFTDLDDTLLDHATYSFQAALPALQLIMEKEIPLVICSSKTRKEIEYYRDKMGNVHPFVTENGGGIFIPKNYFNFEIQSSNFEVKEDFNYRIIILGARYSDLKRVIEELRGEAFHVRGFSDMTAEELAQMTNLDIHEAEMSKERDFDEPFVFEGSQEETAILIKSINSKGFNVTRGRFFHILGDSDKGNAVSILIELYEKEFGEILTVALGDSPNDIPMLERVDYPVIVQKPDGTHDRSINVPRLVRAEGIGPAGWNEAIVRLLSASRLSGQ